MELAEILLAQAKPAADRTVEEQEAVTTYEATQSLKEQVGLTDNGRVFLVAKVAYAVASELGMETEDVAALGDMIKALEESPAKAVILGTAE